MSQHIVLSLTAAVALILGTTGAAQAKGANDNSWPVTHFITETSVIANYYRDFVRHQPQTSSNEQMHLFCDLLLGSDILADRLSQLGGKPSDLHAILMELGSYEFDRPGKFSKGERKHIRRLLLGLDMQLESIDHSLSTGTRREFRREVLADIPPLNRVG